MRSTPSILRRPTRRERRSPPPLCRLARRSRSSWWWRPEPVRYDFMIVDVFTDVAFGGNQLAVLTDARARSCAAMQTLTREFGIPETTFVLPAENPARARRVPTST